MADLLNFPKKRYDVIYADPPWRFKTWSERGKGKSAEKHYQCQDLNWIKSLPIQSISKEDCILFLWITFPFLDKASEVMESWGFKYKGLGFVWVKKNKVADSWFWGCGYWTRQNPEVCLIGTRGKPKRQDAGVHSVVDSRIGKHSEKPAEVRNRIERLMGENVKRIELFARQKTPGWDVWGDDID